MKIGKITENVYKRSILQRIKTRREEVLTGVCPGEDCAVFSFWGDTDPGVLFACMRESAVRMPGTDGCAAHGGALSLRYLFMECVNRIAAREGEAVAVSLSALLPDDTEEEAFRSLVAEAEKICVEQNIQIARAGGRVSEAVREPFVTMVMYGKSRPSDSRSKDMPDHSAKAARPGHDIVVTKWIGLEGTAILAERHREDLLSRYPAWLVDEAAAFERYLWAAPEAAAAVKSGVCAIHPVSEGGIFAALWELAEGAGVGLDINLKRLPIRQETVEICNHCRINPYELMSGGCFLMTAPDGPGLAAALEAEGVAAVTVGKVTDGNDRRIRNEEEVQYLNRPRTDSLYEKGE